MGTDPLNGGRLPAAFLTPGSSSFTDFLTSYAPEMLPGRKSPLPSSVGDEVPHGTTIVAAVYDDGVILAGDRRATAGNVIAVRDVDKVHPADEFSAIAYAGTAGVGHEVVRLFQVELQHYEKIEGTVLSLDGKANYLSRMVRNNLGMAMQGLAVIPLFAGFDVETGKGRIFSYDVTGSTHEERGYHSIGSGSVYARGALKKLYTEGASREQAVAMTLQALYDAADDDSATGGPDVTRRIFPTIATVSDAGYHQLSDDEVAGVVDRLLAGRMRLPDGPIAPALPASEPAGESAEGDDAR